MQLIVNKEKIGIKWRNKDSDFYYLSRIALNKQFSWNNL